MFDWIIGFNEIISKGISPYLPDTGLLGFFAIYPLYSLLVIFIVLGGVALFLDFIKDSWKIPFGILGDLIDIMAMTRPGLFDIIAAIYSFLIFHILASNPHIYRVFASTAGAVEAFIGVGFPVPAVGGWGYLTNIFPTNTILMFIATIVD